jgi:hypothetical protein
MPMRPCMCFEFPSVKHTDNTATLNSKAGVTLISFMYDPHMLNSNTIFDEYDDFIAVIM